MVVQTASYRGLSATKTCGLSDDHRCDVIVATVVKKQCDGQHECNITVDSKRPRKDESDYHIYCHLNKVHIDYANQEETGI